MQLRTLKEKRRQTIYGKSQLEVGNIEYFSVLSLQNSWSLSNIFAMSCAFFLSFAIKVGCR